MPPNYRRCISCRKLAPKSEFLRVVRVYPSYAIALEGMGRSAYLCPDPACIQASRKKDRLSRILKAPVPDPIYQALNQRIADAGAVSDIPTPSRPPAPAESDRLHYGQDKSTISD